jgi:hypothetical protein
MRRTLPNISKNPHVAPIEIPTPSAAEIPRLSGVGGLLESVVRVDVDHISVLEVVV